MLESRGWPAQTLATTRTLTLVLGVLAATVACVMHDIIAALTIGYDLLVGAIFVPVLAAMFTHGGSPMAALTSIMLSAAGVIILILIYGFDSAMPIYGGLLVSASTFLIGVRRLIPS